MVQFNPNLNVGKTAKLNLSAQVGKVGVPDNTKPTKDETKAVWISGHSPVGDYKENDVVLTLNNDGTFTAARLIKNGDDLIYDQIDVSEITRDDYEANRGDLNRPTIYG